VGLGNPYRRHLAWGRYSVHAMDGGRGRWGLAALFDKQSQV